MQTFKYKKRPDETVVAEWSFDARMAEAEVVATPSVTATGVTISSVGASADGRGVACLISGGTNAADVTIKFGIETDLGQELFEEVILRIRNDPHGTT